MNDATSRNALYKIHVSLGKIVNALDEQQPGQRRTSRSVSVNLERQPSEEKILVEEPRIKEEEEDDESSEGTVVVPKQEKENLVEDLLTDDDDVEMEDV